MSLPSPLDLEPLLRRLLAIATEAPDTLAARLDEQTEALIAFTARRVLIAANESAERLLGYARRELDGRSADQLVPARLRQPDAPPAPATDDVLVVEVPALRKDGVELPAVWTYASATGPDGPVFVAAVQARRDVLALATEQQFRLLVDTMPVLAWYADPDGHIPWYNRRWHEYTGTTLEDQAGWGWKSVHDPDDLPRVLAKWRAALQSGEPWEDEFRLRRHDGVFRWFLSRAHPLRDARGRVLRWFGTNVDIDDQRRAGEHLQRQQRRAEADLHVSEQRFHQLVDAISDYAIFMLDATGHVASWNPGVERIKGYKRDEIVGRHFSVFYPAEDRAAGRPDRILDTVRREGRFEEENWRVRKDGSRFWASVVITALRDEHGAVTGFAKVTRDLTARRAAEENERSLVREQLARAASETARREMERVNRAKDEFLATMSHELRTPLNAIQGWATILRKKPRNEEKLEHGLEVIERNVRTQTRLVNDLLDVSRIISGKLELSLTRTELVPIILSAVDVVRPAADAKGVRLAIDVDPEVGAALADGDRMRQVVWNLLSNAVRFTPRGGRVTVTADRVGSGVTIRVQDTGAGIAPEHLPHLFERFMQVDSSTTRAHGGLGLGLSIVRHLVEAHGGTVEAQSDGLGRGAAFTVTLPVPAADLHRGPSDPADADGAGGDDRPAATLDGVRILVVDDDADSLDVLGVILRGAGATVTTAASAGEAFEVIARSAPFDLVISDIGMPEMDGYAFLRGLRSREAGGHVPAIAITAYARAVDAEAARDAGFQAHLAKPVDARRLVREAAAWARQDRCA